MRVSLIIALMTVCILPVLSQESYLKNPVMTEYNCQDASVIKDGECYYMFASCNKDRKKNVDIPFYGANIFRSKEMLNWQFYKRAFAVPDTIINNLTDEQKHEFNTGKYLIRYPDGYHSYHIWSPEIMKYKKHYYLFVTLNDRKHDSKIALFKTEDLSKDFVFEKIVVSSNLLDGSMALHSEGIIDPFVVKEGKKIYLIFGTFARNLNGDIIKGREKMGVYIVELNKNLDMKGVPSFITDLYEGVVVFKNHGEYFLFGSNGNFRNNTYQLHYAKSKSIRGPYKNEKGESIADTINVNFGTKLLETPNPDITYNGFGCMSSPMVDQNKRFWTLVNGHDLSLQPISVKSSREERYEFLLELLWDKNGNPFFDMDAIQDNKLRTPNFK